MSPYRVLVVGMGKRGRHHAAAFKANPRFELAAVCSRDPARVEQAARDFEAPRSGTDPLALAREVRPDVFCFCTPPDVRLPLIEAGIACGAPLIAYEKPMALSMNEAIAIRSALAGAGVRGRDSRRAVPRVKSVVSHQHRYGVHYRKVAEIIESGALGRVHTVYGHAVGWMMHMLTHLIDLMRWYSGGGAAEWVMAQAAGRGKLSDVHPSPDYLAGAIQFANGVRGWVECGGGAPDVPEVDYWWRKCRVGAQGTEGFAEVLTGAGWRAVTSSGMTSGEGCMNYDLDMPPYVDQMADWLDDASRVHPCNGESAYQGFEIAMALLRSVVDRGQVKLPLGPGEPELEALRRALPDRPVLLSSEVNRPEYS